MKTWWLWRLKPHPKKLLFRDLELPVSYLAADPLLEEEEEEPGSRTTGASMSHEYRSRLLEEKPSLGRLLERLELELGQRGIQTDGFVRQEGIGGMRAFTIDVRTGSSIGRQKLKRYWLTPPVEQVVDLKKHFSDESLRGSSPGYARENKYLYFANRDVLEATGEYLSGSLESSRREGGHEFGAYRIGHLQNLRAVVEMGEASDVTHFMMVAFDSFLEHGRPDPRFNPRRSRR